MSHHCHRLLLILTGTLAIGAAGTLAMGAAPHKGYLAAGAFDLLAVLPPRRSGATRDTRRTGRSSSRRAI